jgi:virginiamycin B lyase
MTATTTPAPRPLCAAFAPLLPLLSSGALEEHEAMPTREHVAGCAWCQQELARYTAVDEALRREFGATHENILPFPFDLDGDEDAAEDYAFTLEDTLEETMAEGHDPRDSQPSTTTRSSRWGERRRGPSPRATAIGGIAAALILAVVATAVYAQFAARRTISSPAATKTSSAFTMVALPNAKSRTITQLTTAPDGSLWFADSFSRTPKIGHVTPEGAISEFPVPTDDSLKVVYIYGIAVGSDGAIWFSGQDSHGSVFSNFIKRMSPDGIFTTISLPADLTVGGMIAGPDSALWFAGERNADTRINLVGRVTTDGHITTFPSLSQGIDSTLLDLCLGPDNAIWYTWMSSLNNASTVTGRVGRISLSGQVQEFATPYAPFFIASGSDGALWYSEIIPNTSGDGQAPTVIRKGYIGRMTTAGVASELPIDPNLSIDRMIAGSDGAIWFTVGQDEAGKFGRITPSGEVKTFTTGGNFGIALIAAAPGALWLLDAQNNLWRYRLPE